MNNYAHTIKTWDQLAQQYQDGFMDLNIYDESYTMFCDLLEKKNARILEIGCGPGNITNFLLSKRPDFKIHATDAAPSMLALAKINNPSITFEMLDARNIDKLKTKFDAIVCGFCLPYLSKTDCNKFIKNASQLLNINGLLYISIIEGDYKLSKVETSTDGKHSMNTYYYSEDFFTKIFLLNNLSIDKTIRVAYNRNNFEQSSHLIFIARKL
jgi:cyclopropane fatty-acyl-phospholipid synthase-like methyltransferase